MKKGKVMLTTVDADNRWWVSTGDYVFYLFYEPSARICACSYRRLPTLIWCPCHGNKVTCLIKSLKLNGAIFPAIKVPRRGSS